MSVKVYENGAFRDVDYLRRYENGAWRDCEAAYRYDNSTGAWIEVWSSMEYFSSVGLPTYGNIYVEPRRGEYISYTQDTNGTTGTMPVSGYIDLRLKGEWLKPTVSFDWEGGLFYWNTSYTRGYRTLAGNVSVTGRYNKSDGTENYDFFGSATVGSDASWPNQIEYDSGTVSYVGTNPYHVYHTIRITISPSTSNTRYFDASKEITVLNFFINGKQIGFPLELNDFHKG